MANPLVLANLLLFIGHSICAPLVKRESFSLHSSHSSHSSHSLHENVCPPYTLLNQRCPPVCTDSLDSCESQPACVPPQLYCLSTAACVEFKNDCPYNNVSLCDCPHLSRTAPVDQQRYTGFIPCPAQTVNLTFDHTRLRSELLEEACSASLRENCIFADCPAYRPAVQLSTFSNPVFIFVTTLCFLQLLIVAAWCLFRVTNRRKLQAVRLVHDPRLTLFAWQNHWLGTLAYRSLFAFALGLNFALAVLSLDNYGLITGGLAGGLALGDGEAAAMFFVFLWHLTAVYMFVLIFYRELLPICTKLPCKLDDSFTPDVIQVDDGNGAERSFLRRRAIKLAPYCKADGFFEYRHTRYTYRKDGSFVTAGGGNGTFQTPVDSRMGLTAGEACLRLAAIGPNSMKLPTPSATRILGSELWSLTYLYQLMCLWISAYYHYYYVALLQLIMISVSASVKVLAQIKADQKLYTLLGDGCTVSVLRDSRWAEVDSCQLVPGDVIKIVAGMTMPCDCRLLGGFAILNESCLTGEPRPVRKEACGTLNQLFSNTVVLQTDTLSSDEDFCIALVTHTRSFTRSGALLQSILYPKQPEFVFYEQLKVVVPILIAWASVVFLVSACLIYSGELKTEMWFYGIFIVSQLLSPLLPATLVAGQSFACDCLLKKQIGCSHMPSITVSGKVSVVCFDKTGTLTHQGLQFKEFVQQVDDSHSSDICRLAMLACTTISNVGGTLVGNPVDSCLFMALKGKILPASQSGDILSIVQDPVSTMSAELLLRNEFSHVRQTMSVLARVVGTNSPPLVVVKGSYESMKRCCLPESLPCNYDALAQSLSATGGYVLSLGIRAGRDTDCKASAAEMERGLTFLGFIVFENQLREDSRTVIRQLIQGSVKPVIVTGDAPLTAIYIGRQAGVLSQKRFANSAVVLGQTSGDGGDTIEWTRVFDDGSQSRVPDVYEFMTNHNVEFCLNGSSFQLLKNSGSLATIFPYAKIFSRMSPDDKLQVVKTYMDRGHCTAMCGDGGNDCAALKTAHVSVALSDSEAALFASFSSSRKSIGVVSDVLLQGRATLATALSSYKFLIIYGQILAILGLAQAYFKLVISLMCWIALDGLAAVGLSWALTRSLAETKFVCARPTAQVLGAITLVSCLGQVFLYGCFTVLTIALLKAQDWYKCNEFDGSLANLNEWWTLADNFEAETIAQVSMAQVAIVAAACNLGGRFKKRWINNRWFLLVWSVFVSLVAFLILAGPNPFSCLFRMNCAEGHALKAESQERSEEGPSADIYESSVTSWGFMLDSMWDYRGYGLDSIHHNVLPLKFRLTLFALCLANGVLVLALEYLVLNPQCTISSKLVHWYFQCVGKQRRRPSKLSGRETLLHNQYL